MKRHYLRILPEYYRAVDSGAKTFEIRKNDRDFKVGDIITLQEFDNTEIADCIEGYTRNSVTGVITFITDYEQKEGYVVFSFVVPEATR